MKTKLFFTFAFALLASVSQAQFASTVARTSAAVDSLVITDAGTGALQFSFTVPHDAFNAEFSIVRTSGTLAGTAQLQGRNTTSGTWKNVGSAVTLVNGATFAGNVVVTDTPYKFFQWYFSGATTTVYRARGVTYTADY